MAHFEGSLTPPPLRVEIVLPFKNHGPGKKNFWQFGRPGIFSS